MEEIVIEGALDWLLFADVEVATILRRGLLMYVEHYGREPLEVRTSLANQVHRQDPALYALAVGCLSNGNTRLITSPIDDSPAALCAEVQLCWSRRRQIHQTSPHPDMPQACNQLGSSQ